MTTNTNERPTTSAADRHLALAIEAITAGDASAAAAHAAISQAASIRATALLELRASIAKSAPADQSRCMLKGAWALLDRDGITTDVVRVLDWEVA